MNTILEIKNLHANIGNTKILKGINITIKSGEIHAIMGKNGSGKSTLAKIIAGHPSYTITDGDILFENASILPKPPEERAQIGIFLGFQYPIEIPGVSNADFLRLAYNARQKAKGLKELEPLEFFEFVHSKLSIVGMDSSFLTRNVNEGFSGGEKKRNEILQMLLLQPKLVILDEIDSGLDVDAIKIICEGIKSNLLTNSSLIVITHYPRILNYLKPDFVHIMIDGKIIKSGNMELVDSLEKDGYKFLNN